jgi:hypothetical protein
VEIDITHDIWKKETTLMFFWGAALLPANETLYCEYKRVAK